MYFPTDHDYLVIEAMEKRGGSFVVALAQAFRRADGHNFHKLLITFEEYWAKYSKEVDRTLATNQPRKETENGQ